MALSGTSLKAEGLVIPEPDFDVRESSSQLILSVHAPLCSPSNISVFVEKNVLTFEAHPYFFKLKLPCSISDENYGESFDLENGTYMLTFKKKVDIDEECSGEDENYSTNRNSSQFNIENKSGSGIQFYGFVNSFSRMFGLFYKEFSQVINLEDPDNRMEEERSLLRQKEEEKKWSEDHYLADFIENEDIKPLLNYLPQWRLSEIGDLNQVEKEILKTIPKIKCLERDLSDNQKKLAELQMVDVLLSYCYNNRTTEGENSVESAWTINKLSSCLSWLEVFRDLKSVLISFYRRSLIYPLYRNWELAKVIHKDVVSLLKLGSSQVTRCFIEIRELFNETEHFYILNTLFIDPLCHFSNALSEEKLTELADSIEMIEIKKEEVHEDLLILELAAKITLEEENLSSKGGKQMNDMTEKMSRMNFDDSESTSSSDSEDDVSTLDSSLDHVCSGSTSK